MWSIVQETYKQASKLAQELCPHPDDEVDQVGAPWKSKQRGANLLVGVQGLLEALGMVAVEPRVVGGPPPQQELLEEMEAVLKTKSDGSNNEIFNIHIERLMFVEEENCQSSEKSSFTLHSGQGRHYRRTAPPLCIEAARLNQDNTHGRSNYPACHCPVQARRQPVPEERAR